MTKIKKKIQSQKSIIHRWNLIQIFLLVTNFRIERPGRNWEPESPSLKKKLRVAGGEWRVSKKMTLHLPCPSKLMSKIFLENLQNFYKIPCLFKQCIFFLIKQNFCLNCFSRHNCHMSIKLQTKRPALYKS